MTLTKCKKNNFNLYVAKKNVLFMFFYLKNNEKLYRKTSRMCFSNSVWIQKTSFLIS
jgi:hypothetical protein